MQTWPLYWLLLDVTHKPSSDWPAEGTTIVLAGLNSETNEIVESETSEVETCLKLDVAVNQQCYFWSEAFLRPAFCLLDTACSLCLIKTLD